jgi:hypothetical protein
MSDDFDDYYLTPPISYLSEGEDCAGGPLTEDGWYVMHFCDPMCCRPTGPFLTREEALEYSCQKLHRPRPN